jgi:predicted phage terminase large subunit-like protein
MTDLLFVPPQTRQRIITTAIAAATSSLATKRQLDTIVTPHYGTWLKSARPEYRWTARHFRAIQEVLDRVTAGELRRVLQLIPIRHGKTQHSTIGFGGYQLERVQKTRLLVASYNQRQADKLSRQIRKLARSRGVMISDDRDAAAEWETILGGGVRAVGAGAGVASVDADGILIDDPFGSREEAESPTHRDRVWNWITDDILARCEPHTWVILSTSRWHKDDVAGRILDGQAGAWHVLDLPGRAEKNDPLGRPENEPLWPELRGEQWLTEKRAEMGEYGFASLIQGRPRPREGGMFKWSWWQLLEDVPKQGPLVRYWDLAGTEVKRKNHDPDFTAGVLACRMPDKRTAIVDVERFRKSIAARDAQVETTARQDLKNYPGRIRWWIETEAGIAGSDRTADLVRRLQAIGMPVSTEHPTGNKVHRAEPLASKAEAGNVLLCPGEWRNDFRAEASDFPNGTHDDQVDAAAGADSKLAIPIGAWGHSQHRI